MPVKVMVMPSKAEKIVVRVQRPKWRQYLAY